MKGWEIFEKNMLIAIIRKEIGEFKKYKERDIFSIINQEWQMDNFTKTELELN